MKVMPCADAVRLRRPNTGRLVSLADVLDHPPDPRRVRGRCCRIGVLLPFPSRQPVINGFNNGTTLVRPARSLDPG